MGGVWFVSTPKSTERDLQLQKLISVSFVMEVESLLKGGDGVFGGQFPQSAGHVVYGGTTGKHFGRLSWDEEKQNVATENISNSGTSRTKEVASFIQLKSWLPFSFTSLFG